MTEHVRIGLEVLADNPGLLPADGRLGLLQNQASVDDRMRLACAGGGFSGAAAATVFAAARVLERTAGEHD
jgi:hypothetical protein